MEPVIIVGGGIGGLILAALLEKAGLVYIVLERSTTAKMPLEGGGVIVLTTQIQPLLQQLGFLSTLEGLSKPVEQVTVLDHLQLIGAYHAKPVQLGQINFAFARERHGYHNRVISRPELYNFLVDQIPAEKIQLGKQVTQVEQDDDAATCICTDGSKYRGIIIGADGAYSAVRLSLYKGLKEKGLLPASDYKPMWYRSKALVGMTYPDHERFSELGKEAYFSDVKVLVSRGDTPFTLWCVPMSGHRICWTLEYPLASGAKEEEAPDVEDLSYDAKSVQGLCNAFRSFPSPYEGVLIGELLDAVPPNTIFSLPREEASVSTWTAGSIALMGDASHKVLPHFGQSMVQAGCDAVHLANVLYAHSRHLAGMESPEDALAKYAAQRRASARFAVWASHMFGLLMNRQDWIGNTVRAVVVKYAPQQIVVWLGDWMNRSRPQASFLPSVSASAGVV
ncbi:hypothetical protein BGZ93_007744 [Podila epicladia]|nr:hypothetical protein BGZ92_001360 [Podila epicladia]KAG0093755.1 hypothetical protein BGZ93_007744 [Podila epicladia]